MKSRKPKKTAYPKVTTRIKVCGNCGAEGHNTRSCKVPSDVVFQNLMDEEKRMMEAKEKTEEMFKGGAISTKQPRLALLFHQGLVNAAARCELGIEAKGDGALNNLSPVEFAKATLSDTQFLIERCSHAIEHCYKAIGKLREGKKIAMCKEDAGAIAWLGLMLGEAAMTVEN